MTRSIEGIYRNGKVELSEPAPIQAESRVIVTFITPDSVDLASKGISQKQAADLQARLKPMAEDWSRPDMDVYDEL